MKNTLDAKMIEVMLRPEVKASELTVRLALKDGSRRTGIYKDLVSDPLKRYDYKDTLFIKFETNRPEKGMLSYLPVSLINTIEWSYPEGDESHASK